MRCECGKIISRVSERAVSIYIPVDELALIKSFAERGRVSVGEVGRRAVRAYQVSSDPPINGARLISRRGIRGLPKRTGISVNIDDEAMDILKAEAEKARATRASMLREIMLWYVRRAG